MPVCHERKLLFIHIPKNAGKYIEDRYGLSDYPGLEGNQKQRSTLGNISRLLCKVDGRQRSSRQTLRGMLDLAVVGQHLSLSEILHLGLIGSEIESYKLVVSVRNPFTRILSLYRHLVPRFERSQLGFQDFAEKWPVSYNRSDIHNIHAFKKCQTHFIRDLDGNICDRFYILRIENLSADMKKFEEKAGVSPVLNDLSPNADRLQLPNKDNRQYDDLKIDAKVMKSTLNHYRSDFDAFGYNEIFA